MRELESALEHFAAAHDAANDVLDTVVKRRADATPDAVPADLAVEAGDAGTASEP